MSADLAAEGVQLRDLRIKDAADLFPAFSDAANMAYWATPPHAGVDVTAADIRWWIDQYGESAWAITADGETALGRIGVMRQRAGVGEIGVILAPAAQGKGLATAALNLITAHCFDRLDYHRLYGDIDPENDRSVKLFERCGFAREAVLKANWRTHIGLRDSVIYARLRG